MSTGSNKAAAETTLNTFRAVLKHVPGKVALQSYAAGVMNHLEFYHYPWVSEHQALDYEAAGNFLAKAAGSGQDPQFG